MHGHEILSVAESGEADRCAEASGVDSFELMRAAAGAVAQAVLDRWTPRKVVVLCGPGLNGGDGYVAAQLLRAAGWPVEVLALSEPAEGDARRAREIWGAEVAPLAYHLPEDAELVIDALFGAGLKRALEPDAADPLRAAEAAGVPIVAVDLPSGLSGDRAKPLGWAPKAALTVTFHRKKPAHVLQPGRSFCGEILVADIGIPDSCTPRTRIGENHPDLWLPRFPWPGVSAHKHSRGRLGVVSGGIASSGAARLAARGGLRAGAGAVRLYCAPDAVPHNAPHLEAIMLRGFDGPAELERLALEMDAFVIGPAAGLGARTAANLEALSRTGAALVVDADAITLFRERPETLFALLDPQDVLTPHAGEFERLFPGLLAASPQKIAAAREGAERAGATVIFKGPDTVIAAPDGRTCVNTNATPWLATAGSGDVLGGIVGALLAQGMESFDAACAAVWMHAEAGSAFGPGLIAEDLPEQLPAVLRALHARTPH